MRILALHRTDMYMAEVVPNYSGSMVRALRELGHEVVSAPKTQDRNRNFEGIDLVIDIDCGRNAAGDLLWIARDGPLPVPSAVVFIDSHGHPSDHRRVAKNYDHVFFAVWDKRDLFGKHPSAHWCPNFTDLRWFDRNLAGAIVPGNERKDFGMFGSKGGLTRADPMAEICNRNGWKCDIRQIGASNKHAWPSTLHSMTNCKFLFNRAQKHDGPNLRVFESMAAGRPLICDFDPRSGMEKLFAAGGHYLPYEYFDPWSGMETAMKWCMDNQTEANLIAEAAYQEVKKNHLVANRVKQIIEVVRQ